jgi:hypothetical protein
LTMPKSFAPANLPFAGSTVRRKVPRKPPCWRSPEICSNLPADAGHEPWALAAQAIIAASSIHRQRTAFMFRSLAIVALQDISFPIASVAGAI